MLEEGKGWAWYPPEEELVSPKQISHSSDNLMDQLAEEIRTTITLAECWVGSYPDFLGTHISCPLLKLKPQDKTLSTDLREPSDLFTCSSSQCDASNKSPFSALSITCLLNGSDGDKQIRLPC